MFFFFGPVGESKMRDVPLCQFGRTSFSTKYSWNRIYRTCDLPNLLLLTHYKQPSVLLCPQHPLVAIPSGDMTRREWVPYIDPELCLSWERVIMSLSQWDFLMKSFGFLWSFYLTGVTPMCQRTMEITPTHAVGPLPYKTNIAKIIPMATSNIKRNGWGVQIVFF